MGDDGGHDSIFLSFLFLSFTPYLTHSKLEMEWGAAGGVDLERV